MGILTSNFEAGGIACHRRKLPLPKPLRRPPPLRKTTPLPHTRDLYPVFLTQISVRIGIPCPQEEYVTRPELDALLLRDGLDALVSDAVRSEVVDANSVTGGIGCVVD